MTDRITPQPAQAADLDIIEAAGYRALVNIEPGGGKTALSAWAIERSGSKVTLVIAPKQTHITAWAEDVKRAIGREVRVIGNDRKATKIALADFELGVPGIYLATPQFFTKTDVSNWSGDMLIVDEHHLLNSAKTKGQRKLTGYTPKEQEEALTRRFPMCLALSGTSWRNSFSRAWATMRLLWWWRDGHGDIAYDNYYAWQGQRMDYEEVYTNQRDQFGKPKKVKQFLNEKVPGTLISEAPCVITHFRRHECCEFHPTGFLPHEKPNVTEHIVDLTPAQKRAIRELEDHYMTWLEDQPLTVELTLTQKQRIRQLTLGVPTLTFDEDDKVNVDFDVDCESPFYEEVLSILEELPEEEPVTVFLESQRFARVLTEKLNRDGIPAFEYSGATVKTREADKAQFGSKFRVAVVSLAAGGTGMSGLHYVCKTEIWVETSVDDVNNVQGEARVDRMGGRGQVDRHFIHDSMGRSQGKMSEQLEKREALARTLRRAA